MSDFNVGDVLISKKYPDNEGLIVMEVSNGGYKLSRDGYNCGTYRCSYTETMFRLKTPANPDLITVSSLDYMTNKALTKEDKLIIKEALTNV